MALQITETRRMFSVHGVLNRGNVAILKRHLSRFLHPNKPVILNLERVLDIDMIAAHTLHELYLHAMRSNQVLSIIGMENGNILPTLKATKTTNILSHDRI